MNNNLVFGPGQPPKTIPFTQDEEAQRAIDHARPPRVPKKITKVELVRALRAAGKLAVVKAQIAQSGADIREDWEASAAIHRTDPGWNAIYTGAGLSETEVDDLFRAGGAL
jgi:hypothetical protein